MTSTLIASVIALIFQCKPIHKAWDSSVEGTCLDRVAIFFSNAGLNIAQDIIIYFLPVSVLWKLNIPRNQAIAIIFVFVIGGFVVITSMIRLKSLTTAAASTDTTCEFRLERLYRIYRILMSKHQGNNFDATVWSSIECSVCIVCASLVHFKAALSQYAPHVLGIQHSDSSRIRIPDNENMDLVIYA